MLSFDRPWRLRPDNFTPVARTPWGGRAIVERYKKELPLGADPRSYSPVGESWEVSTETLFPSLLVDDPQLSLADAIAKDRSLAVGPRLAEKDVGLPLLVKWIDARDALSIQVHPSRDYAGLRENECGKHEVWFIVDSEPGAGLYLGLKAGISASDVAAAIERGDSLAPLMRFLPATPGMAFDIAPGTIHAIGAGVVLIEVQDSWPTKSSVTYRLWDWNRRYGPTNQPRELHLQQAFDVLDAGLTPNPTSGPVETPGFICGVVSGNGTRELENTNGSTLTVYQGSVEILGMLFKSGESLFCPAAMGPTVQMTLRSASAVWSSPRV